jgi:hypothetical protein
VREPNEQLGLRLSDVPRQSVRPELAKNESGVPSFVPQNTKKTPSLPIRPVAKQRPWSHATTRKTKIVLSKFCGMRGPCAFGRNAQLSENPPRDIRAAFTSDRDSRHVPSAARHFQLKISAFSRRPTVRDDSRAVRDTNARKDLPRADQNR